MPTLIFRPKPTLFNPIYWTHFSVWLGVITLEASLLIHRVSLLQRLRYSDMVSNKLFGNGTANT